MFEWLKKQEKIVVILLLAIPFVNWIVELICRGDRLIKELDKKPEAKEGETAPAEAAPAEGEAAPKAEGDNKDNSLSDKAVTSIVMFVLCFPLGTLLGWVDLVMYLTGNKFILED